MRIGELCKRAGVSRDTIRYYERMGLLGFTLAEIGDVVHVWESPTFGIAQKVECLQAKLAELDAKSLALSALRAGLLNALAKVGGDCVEGEIA
jgi:DNA-binding transcriptional MerR regulator